MTLSLCAMQLIIYVPSIFTKSTDGLHRCRSPHTDKIPVCYDPICQSRHNHPLIGPRLSYLIPTIPLPFGTYSRIIILLNPNETVIELVDLLQCWMPALGTSTVKLYVSVENSDNKALPSVSSLYDAGLRDGSIIQATVLDLDTLGVAPAP